MKCVSFIEKRLYRLMVYIKTGESQDHKSGVKQLHKSWPSSDAVWKWSDGANESAREENSTWWVDEAHFMIKTMSIGDQAQGLWWPAGWVFIRKTEVPYLTVPLLSHYHISTRWRGRVRRTVRGEETGQETVNNSVFQDRAHIYLFTRFYVSRHRLNGSNNLGLDFLERVIEETSVDQV